jgi:molybdopterin/thiamine biosynthesis adenylyltransferase
MAADALCWKPGYAPMRLPDGALRLQAGHFRGGSYLLGSQSELLARLAAMIDQRRTESEVLAVLPPVERAAGRAILAQLQLAGLLVTRPAVPGWSVAQGVRDYLTLFSPELDVSQRLHAARFLVIGLGALGSRVAVGLAQLGVQQITLIDETEIQPDDRQLCLVYGLAPRGLKRASYLARLLKRIHPGVATRRVPMPGRWDGQLGQHDFVICAVDRPDFPLWDALNDAALRCKTPWALLTSDGLQAFVGPTFFPGQTACAACWEASQGARGPMAERFVGLGALADMAAGFLIADLPRLLTQTGGLTAGRALTIDFVTLGCDLIDLPKQPRCPACSSLNHSRLGR